MTRYGFGGRLTEAFPSQLNIDLTEVCNLACIHCSHALMAKSEHYTGAFLPLELNKKAVDEVRDFGKGSCEYIRYTGAGEPFLHKDLFSILKYAVDNSGVTVTLTANGTLINEEKAKRFLDTGTNLIDISIDAFLPETYARIRVNGNLEVTRRNILRLIELKRQFNYSTKIVVSYIEQPGNMAETERFEEFWKQAGVDFVVIRRCHSNCGSLEGRARELREKNAEQKRTPCIYPWERIALRSFGALSYCPGDWVRGSVMADYRTATIHETWNSEKYWKLRQAHLDNDYSGFPICSSCPDWSQVRWPEEGRAYANMIEDFNHKDS